MVSIPQTVSQKPTALVAVVLVITSALGSIYLLAGGEMEASERTFMPENEVVDASNEINRLFTSTELSQILVKGSEGNVLVPESLVEILQVERALTENPTISRLLVDEANPMRISSIADTIFQAANLLNTIKGMVEGIGPQFDSIKGSLGQVAQVLSLTNDGIRNAMGTPYLRDAVLAANSTIIQLATQLAQMGGSMVPSGESGGETYQGFEPKIQHFSALTQEELGNVLAAIMNYDESSTDGMVGSVKGAAAAAEATALALDELSQLLIAASQDPSIVQDQQAMIAIGTTGFTLPLIKNGVLAIRDSAESLNIQRLERQLDSGMEALRRAIRLSLTTDFSPETGTYRAKATLAIVGFNATLARSGEGRVTTDGRDREGQGNESVMLHAQQSMVEVIGEQDLVSTNMAVIGMDLTSRRILEATQDSFAILLPAAFILVIIVLALVYRNVMDMVVSLLALGFAIVWTYGLGTLAGFVFNPMTLAVPVIIVGLGIDYGIHLTLRYREERSQGMSPRESARTSISWVGSALLIATMATMAAFMSNLTSEMSALKDFGILLAVGLASAFVIMVTFVPSVRQLIDGRSESRAQQPKSQEKPRRSPRASAALGAGATAAEHHPRVVIVATLLVTALALLAATRLETRFELEDFLPAKLEYARDIRFILEEFNATGGSANILIQGDISSPAVLKAIQACELNMIDNRLVAVKATPLGDRPDVDSVVSLMKDVATDESLTDPLDLYSQEFALLYHSASADGDDVPEKDVEALLTWLYESNITASRTRSMLHRDAQGRFDSTVMRIAIVSDSMEDADELLAELNADAGPLEDLVGTGELSRATVTGSSIMAMQIISSLKNSLSVSFIFTLVVSFIIMTIVFYVTERSMVLGAITMIPVLLCSAWILGSMYVLGIAYTVLTVMITALTIGLGVTYGIHLTHRFVEEMREHEDVDDGCMETVAHTGSALFGAAATTVAGFGLLVFSLLPPIQEFGAIVALTIIYSFLATVFILPTFLVIWAKRVRKRGATVA